MQHGRRPVCTFAYAVTRRGGRRVLRWAGNGQDEAFDVRLSRACRTSSLEILVVQPELMHQYKPPTDSGFSSEVAVGNGKGATGSEEDFEASMGHTENILHSARCRALFDSTCLKSVH